MGVLSGSKPPLIVPPDEDIHRHLRERGVVAVVPHGLTIRVEGESGDDDVVVDRQHAVDLVPRAPASPTFLFESLMNREQRVEAVHGGAVRTAPGDVCAEVIWLSDDRASHRRHSGSFRELLGRAPAFKPIG